MIESATGFPYLGDRDYIHGTSILSGFLAALEATARGSITVKRLKFQRPAKTNGRLELAPGPLDEREAALANCTLTATVNEQRWHGLFIEEGKPVADRTTASYALAEIEAQGYGGTCEISATGRDDLIRVLVEANRRLHAASFPGGAPTVRFGYLENWSVPAGDIKLACARLEVRNLIARETADGVMTINRLTYSTGEAATASLTLCFDISRTPRA